MTFRTWIASEASDKDESVQVYHRTWQHCPHIHDKSDSLHEVDLLLRQSLLILRHRVPNKQIIY